MFYDYTISKSKAFVVLCVFFSGGILLASVASIETLYAHLALALCAIFITLCYGSKKPTPAFMGLCLLVGVLGCLRMNASLKTSGLETVIEMKRQLEGYIVEDPDVREDKQLLTFQPNGYQERILLTTSLYNRYAYGDWVVVEGKIREAKNFDDFDYKGYLERFNVYAVVQYPKILVLKTGQGNPVKELLLAVKAAFARRVANFVQKPQSDLLLGILIGAKKALSKTLTDQFTTVGLSHIVAVSGYNISILIGALKFMAEYIGRRASFWLSLALIAGFVVISGASASVIRAACMGGLLLLSFRVGRLYAIIPSLCAAAVAMLIINPRILYWDIGFQLSFAATLGIVLFVPMLEKVTEHWPNPLQFKSILFSTFAAIIATLPLILFHFGRLSTIAPAANLMVLPLIPYIMLFGFLTILPVVGSGFGFVAGLFLSYVIGVTEVLSSLPYASVPVKAGIGLLGTLTVAVALIYLILRRFLARKPGETLP